MKSLPGPIAVAWKAYQQEKQSFIKLHRLIYTYEALIKYTAVITIQNFYTAGLAHEFSEKDDLFRSRLSVPSLGHWLEMLREGLGAFAEHEADLFCRDLYLFHFRRFDPKPKMQKWFVSARESERLLAFRNKLAHGAIMPDDEAAARLPGYEQDIQMLLDQADFLIDLPLFFIEAQISPGVFHTKSMMGTDYVDTPLTVLHAELLPEQEKHVIIHNPRTGSYLDLYPLLLYAECREEVPTWDTGHKRIVPRKCSQYKALYFNDIQKERFTFLDYWQGHHSRYKAPDPLPGAFREHFSKPERPVQPARWFEDFIYQLTEYFVGRETELAALDNFVSASPKQVLVVVSAPGMGKSTLLAKWAADHKVVRHFIREGDALTYDSLKFLENLALQVEQKLDLRWERPRQAEPGAYWQAFEMLLAQAVEKTSETIVLVVDGLDEAVRAAARDKGITENRTILDWLPDPQLVPDQVRWILSTRPELKEHPTWTAKFGRDKAEWLELGRLSDDEVRALLFQVHSKYDVLGKPEYIEAIVEKSEGCPLYLRMLSDDLIEGRLTFGEVSALPTGVVDYFERILEFIENEGRTREMPDVETLLKAKRATLESLIEQGVLPREQLEQQITRERAALDGQAGLKSVELLALYCMTRELLPLQEAAEILKTDLVDTQRAFDVIRTVLIEDGHGRYTIFHTGFRDYFLRLDKYTEIHFHRYADTIADVHQRLLAYCACWQEYKSPYALHHYAAHLAEAKEWETLHELVATGDDKQLWAEARCATEGSYASYLADLALVWENVEFTGLDTVSLGRQMRYALIESSIHSLASNIPAPMIPAMVQYRFLEPHAALEYARQVSYPEQRSLIIKGLVPYLRDLPDLLQEAVWLAQESDGVDALIASVPYLPKTSLQELGRAMRGSKMMGWQRVLGAVESRLARLSGSRQAELFSDVVDDTDGPEPSLDPVTTRTIQPERSRTESLDLLTVTWGIQDKMERAWMLVEIIPHLPKVWQEQAVQEALSAARETEYERDRTMLLAELIPYLPKPLNGEVLFEALTVLQRTESERGQAITLVVEYPRLIESLVIVIPDLPETKRVQALNIALMAIRAIDVKWWRAMDENLGGNRSKDAEQWRVDTLKRLVPHLTSSLLGDALEAALAIKKGYQAQALAVLTPLLPKPLLKRTLTSVLDRKPIHEGSYYHAEPWDVVAEFDGEYFGYQVDEEWQSHEREELFWEVLTPKLTKKLLQDMLDVMREIGDSEQCSVALDQLATLKVGGKVDNVFPAGQDILWHEHTAREIHSEDNRGEALSKALNAARELYWEKDQVQALAEISKSLLEPMRINVVREALEIALAIEDTDWRLDTLDSLIPVIGILSPRVIYPLWKNTLHSLASRTRRDLLSSMKFLIKFVLVLEGREALDDIACAIQDVGRWWP